MGFVSPPPKNVRFLIKKDGMPQVKEARTRVPRDLCMGNTADVTATGSNILNVKKV